MMDASKLVPFLLIALACLIGFIAIRFFGVSDDEFVKGRRKIT